MTCENICRLGVILKNLDKYAKNIIKKLLPLMKDYNAPNSKKITKLATEMNLPEKDCLDVVKNELLRLMSEAECVKNEMERFCGFILENEIIDVDICPFLGRVWFGDIYSGENGLECLERFEEDFCKLHDNLSSEYIYQNSIEIIKKGE